jgi:hypothetical protein
MSLSCFGAAHSSGFFNRHFALPSFFNQSYHLQKKLKVGFLQFLALNIPHKHMWLFRHSNILKNPVFMEMGVKRLKKKSFVSSN